MICKNIDIYEKNEFNKLCSEIALEELHGEGIGTLGEKRLHKTLKRYICPDVSCHEIRIKKDGEADIHKTENDAAESGRGGYIADVFFDNKIFEIQTGSFYPLKNKIKFYLENTDFDVTIVHPMEKLKWVSWIDESSGDISKKHKSPKKIRFSDILPETFWLSDFLSSDKLHFRLIFLEIEEYRMLNGWSHDKKRGSSRYERIPVQIYEDVTFDANSIAKELFPCELKDEFTSKDFAKATKLTGRKLSFAIKLMCNQNVISRGEKSGRSYIYRKNNQNIVKESITLQ